MADIFDEVGKPQAQAKQGAVSAPPGGDVFEQAAKQVYSPANQDQALQRLETSPGDKWYQQRVDVSPEAGPISRFAGNIIGNPSLQDLGTGLKQVVSHPLDSARTLLDSSGEQQRDLFNRAKREWNIPGVGAKADAAAHAVESAIPFIGPSLAHVGDQFATGDIAGGAGGVTGMTAAAFAAPEARETATAPARATGRLIAQPTASRLAGGAAGAAIGEELQHPYLGFLAGERVLGPSFRYYGTKLSRLGLDRGPRPLFDLSTGQPPSMVMGALSRSDPASPSPISVEEPRPTPYRRGPGEVPRDVIRPRGLLTSGEPQPGTIAAPEQPIRFSLGIPENPAPVRIGPGGVPPDLIGRPNARVLAGNQGVRTTPIGLLREPRLVQESAFMNPELGLPSPRAELKPGMRESMEDASIQDAMQGIRTTPIAALPAHAGENAELAIGERPTEYAPIYNTPHTLSGEGALRQVLTGQDNKALLQIARARGIDVAKEAQLKPGIADAKLINKIIDDFSPDELDEIRARYLENTRHGARLGDIGPEAWKTLSLQSYFPDLKISQARLSRTRAAIERARPQPAPPMGVPGEPTDLTPLLEKSLRRVRQQRASSAAAND